MKNNKWYVACAGILLATVITGCSTQSQQLTDGTSTITPQVQVDGFIDDTLFDWKNESYTTVHLEEGSQTITASGIYELTGTLEEGSINVVIDDTVDEGVVYLVLNEAHIHSEVGTPIHIESAKEVVLLLEANTHNTVTQGTIVTEDETLPSAAIYSKADMQIVGKGALEVTTTFNDGITSKDNLYIQESQLIVDAAGDGIVGKDLLAIQDATIQIKAGKDGLRATNATDEGRGNIVLTGGAYTIQAANDGIQAEKLLEIESGTFNIASGNGYTGVIKVNAQEQQADSGMMMPPPVGALEEGQGGDTDMIPERGQMPRPDRTTEGQQMAKPGMGQVGQSQTVLISGEETLESMKGLKAGTDIVIHDGLFNISAYEDGVHADGGITIKGGAFAIEAGDDGIHAEQAVTIEAGDIVIANSYEGIEGNGITIIDGDIAVTSTDDAINVADTTSIFIMNGGDMHLVPGNDGIDSNGDITITGGHIVIDTTSINERNSAVDSEGTITFTGGVIIDQNGEVIDPTVQKHPGGAGGGGKPVGGKRTGM